MLLYEIEVVILLNMLLNFKSKIIIISEKLHIDRKQGKLTYESNPSEDPNIKKQKLKQTKRLKCVFFTTSNLRFVAMQKPS